MYTGLIFWTSYSLELANKEGLEGLGTSSFLVALVVSLGLTMLYAWLIVSKNRRVWATFKCIGYTNSNISSLILGQIIFTTLMGFIIVIEVLFHYTAFTTYWLAAQGGGASAEVLIGLIPVVITSATFLVIQIIGFMIMRGKITKVRPMIALKKVGE